MSVNLSLFAGVGWQFFDSSGNVLTGGKIYSYDAGTTTPQVTYTTSTGAPGTEHPNPIILNAAGRVPSGGEIWLLDGVSYKFVLADANDAVIATYDNVDGNGSGIVALLNAFISDLANTSNPAKGDALVGFRQSNALGNLTGAVGRTVHQKLQEMVSVKDFGATGDGVTNDTVAIQAAIDSFGSDGGVLYFPPGEYLVARNIGVNDRWGIKVTSSNITLKGDQASLRRYDSNISTYALAYPILFVGVPDSNVAALTENVVIDSLYFIGENTQHNISGSSPHDFRNAIEFKNTSDTWVKDCIFTAIDSAAINYQSPATYDYANNVYYNTTKNYKSKITGCSFIAESHSVATRALIHAITISGVDFINISHNYFEWCDDCVSGETTYNTYQNTENDLFSYTTPASRVALGAVKRCGRNAVIDGNVAYNSSEHAFYISNMDSVVSNNNIRTDEPTICDGDQIKIRGRGITCAGNIISNYLAGITINEAAQDVTVSGNTLRLLSGFAGGAIDINSDGLSSYISNREAFYVGGSPDYQPMRNISIVGNTIIFPDTAVTVVAGREVKDSAFRIYTSETDANYPEGQIQNIVISNNTIKGYNIGVLIINSLFFNTIVSGNSFYAKAFTTSGFAAGTALNTYSVITAYQSGAGGTITSMRRITFSGNFVYGATYLFATDTGAGGAGTYSPPRGITGNRFEYIKNIKTADVANFSVLERFRSNTGNFFLDRTWSGSAMENSLNDGTTSNSIFRYCTQWTGTNYRFYTDDAGSFINLN